MCSAVFKEIFVFVILHLLDVKFYTISDNEISMIADILVTAK